MKKQPDAEKQSKNLSTNFSPINAFILSITFSLAGCTVGGGSQESSTSKNSAGENDISNSSSLENYDGDKDIVIAGRLVLDQVNSDLAASEVDLSSVDKIELTKDVDAALLEAGKLDTATSDGLALFQSRSLHSSFALEWTETAIEGLSRQRQKKILYVVTQTILESVIGKFSQLDTDAVKQDLLEVLAVGMIKGKTLVLNTDQLSISVEPNQTYASLHKTAAILCKNLRTAGVSENSIGTFVKVYADSMISQVKKENFASDMTKNINSVLSGFASASVEVSKLSSKKVNDESHPASQVKKVILVVYKDNVNSNFDPQREDDFKSFSKDLLISTAGALSSDISGIVSFVSSVAIVDYTMSPENLSETLNSLNEYYTESTDFLPPSDLASAFDQTETFENLAGDEILSAEQASSYNISLESVATESQIVVTSTFGESGVEDVTFPDSDGDTFDDNVDAFPNDASEWLDTDRDGVGDNADVFPSNSSETLDSDGDGVGDNADAFPNDGTETVDSDNDGVGDNTDPFPNDGSETVDTDGDGVGDNSDAFPNDSTETLDSDNDGVGDNADAFPSDSAEVLDSDGDGVGDNTDAFPYNGAETIDTDSDGIGDNEDVYPYNPQLSSLPTVKHLGSVIAIKDSEGNYTLSGNVSYAPGNNISTAGFTSFIGGNSFVGLNESGGVVAWNSDTTEIWSQLTSGVTDIFASNEGVYAAIKTDGKLLTWGNVLSGADSTSVDGISSGVEKVAFSSKAVAAMKQDGTVVTWGDSSFGGDSSGVSPSGLVDIFSNKWAFVGLTTSGSVVAWGDNFYGGDVSSVSTENNNIVEVVGSHGAFAARKTDGSVIAWGSQSWGGDINYQIWPDVTALDSGVVSIAATEGAFAAVKDDGSAVVWGNSAKGAIPSNTAVHAQLGSGVSKVAGTRKAFAALKNDSLVVWGDSTYGGIPPAGVSSSIASGVINIFANDVAFAALKSNGAVVTWGSVTGGGDSTAVSSELASDVVDIIPSKSGFLAIKNDGSFITWGSLTMNGKPYGIFESIPADTEKVYQFSSSVIFQSSLGALEVLSADPKALDVSSVSSAISSGVAQVYTAGNFSYAALKSDGSVLTWGNTLNGGDSSAVSANLSDNVTSIFSTGSAFAALKNDGSVYAWGNTSSGGDLSGNSANLSSGVVSVSSNYFSFAALKSSGDVIAWGNSTHGGSSPAVTDAQSLFSNKYAYTAIRTDGSLYSWGNVNYGGTTPPTSAHPAISVYNTEGAFAVKFSDGSLEAWGNSNFGGQADSVSSDLSSGIHTVSATRKAFAALKQAVSGYSVVTWGDAAHGGDSSSVSTELSSDVVELFATNSAFAALKSDGSAVFWGNPMEGGDIGIYSSVISSEGVAEIHAGTTSFVIITNEGSIFTIGGGYYSLPMMFGDSDGDGVADYYDPTP